MDKADGQGARPTSAEQGAATRQAILNAAIGLIGEVGWGQVTTRGIATRAGVPHGAVSYHFSGKNDLLRAAALEAMVQVLGETLVLVRQAGSVREVLDGTFAWYASGALADPSVALLLEILREATRDEQLRVPVAEVLRDYRAALTELVRRDQAKGAVHPGVPPEAVASIVAGLLDGLLLHCTLDPDVDIPATAAAVHTLLGGR